MDDVRVEVASETPSGRRLAHAERFVTVWRRARWLMLSVAGIIGVGLMHASTAGACLMTASDFEIEGIARSIEGSHVVYEVTTVVGLESEAGPNPAAPEVGAEIDVAYAIGEQRFIEEGGAYFVPLWSDAQDGDFSSSVAKPAVACGGDGTRHADRSVIDMSRSRTSGLEPWVGAVVVVTVTAALLLAVDAIRSTRAQRRERRLRGVTPSE